MAIFNSYVKLSEGTRTYFHVLGTARDYLQLSRNPCADSTCKATLWAETVKPGWGISGLMGVVILPQLPRISCWCCMLTAPSSFESLSRGQKTLFRWRSCLLVERHFSWRYQVCCLISKPKRFKNYHKLPRPDNIDSKQGGLEDNHFRSFPLEKLWFMFFSS